MPSIRNSNLPIWILAFLAIMVTMHVTATLFAPVFLAFVLGIVLAPVADRFSGLGLPNALSALLSLLLTLFLILTLMFLIEPILSTAISRAPLIMQEVREFIESAQAALRGIEEAGDQMAEALGDDSGSDEENQGAPVSIPSATEALLYAPGYAARGLIFIGTLYFFLLSRTDVYRWVEKTNWPISSDDLMDAEKQVSRYFLTITIINCCLGFAVGLCFMAIGMPYAVLWGFAAALLNFILYLGPASLIVALLLGGFVTFDGPMSFAPMAIYLALNSCEAQFVTPTMVGKTMSVNPLLVFLSLVVWLWMWGPVGGIIAIPLLVWTMQIGKCVIEAQTISSGTPGKLRPNLRAG